MTEERQEFTTVSEGTPRWLALAVVALAAVSLLALGVGWTARDHARNLEQSAVAQTKALQQNVDALTQRLAQVDDTNAQLQGELHAVTSRLKLTQGEVVVARRQTKQVKEEASKQLDSVRTELASKASADDVKSLGTDVSGVKTDLENTKQNLQMARGEFGTLIARNHEEIDQLRRLGERDYIEFTLSRKGSRQKVGNLMVELRGTNVKRHVFSVALYVDDMRLEKKNRSIDEPIYFYTRGVRAPLELVVNKVGKNTITGYVSIPKAGASTAAAASASSNN